MKAKAITIDTIDVGDDEVQIDPVFYSNGSSSHDLRQIIWPML